MKVSDLKGVFYLDVRILSWTDNFIDLYNGSFLDVPENLLDRNIRLMYPNNDVLEIILKS